MTKMAKSLSLCLYHGRDTVEEEMNDQGYNGPQITGIKYMCSTYEHWKVAFVDRASFLRAQLKTGWAIWDDEGLILKMYYNTRENLIGAYDTTRQDWAYYGQWAIDPEE